MLSDLSPGDWVLTVQDADAISEGRRSCEFSLRYSIHARYLNVMRNSTGSELPPPGFEVSTVTG